MQCYVCNHDIENQDNEELIKCPNCHHNIISKPLLSKQNKEKQLKEEENQHFDNLQLINSLKYSDRSFEKAIQFLINYETRINEINIYLINNGLVIPSKLNDFGF